MTSNNEENKIYIVDEETTECTTEENIETVEGNNSVVEEESNDENIITNEEELENIKYDEKDINYASSNYDLTLDETKIIVKIIDDYNNGNTEGLYDKLPQKMKDVADTIGKLYKQSTGQRLSKDNQAAYAIDSLISDAKFNSVVDDYKNEINETVNDINKEYSSIFTEAFENTFNRIDEIAKESPEQANRIIKVKESFDKAISLEQLKEFCKSDKIYKIKLNKKVDRFKDEVFFFNKKVNITDVKIPNIGELLDIINYSSKLIFNENDEYINKFSIENIKKFIICIIYSTIDLDINDIENLAYLYRLIDNIYKYKFVTDFDDKSELLFRNIAEVIDIINSR